MATPHLANAHKAQLYCKQTCGCVQTWRNAQTPASGNTNNEPDSRDEMNHSGRCCVTRSTYAKRLNVFAEGVCGESLLNLHTVLTAVPLFRNIFLGCQFTDRCKLGRKRWSNISQRRARDRNGFLKAQNSFLVPLFTTPVSWPTFAVTKIFKEAIFCLFLWRTKELTKVSHVTDHPRPTKH